MQEVFLRAQRFRPSYDEQTPLAWLYTLAAHCCFDLKKKKGRLEVLAPDALEAVDLRQTGSAKEADRRAIITLTLERLDSTTRDIGLLHHLGGLTQDEVAEATGYSRRSIGKKLKTFAGAFTGEAEPEGDAA